MNGTIAGGRARGEPALRCRGTELSNCLLRAERAAHSTARDSGRTLQVVYVEGGTVYFYLIQPEHADDALLERLRRGLLRELGFCPQLVQVC